MPKLVSARASTLLFCIIVLLTNWHYSQKVVTNDGLSRMSYAFHLSGAAFVILFSLLVGGFLGLKVYRRIRNLLDLGIRVPRQKRLVDLAPAGPLCLLLLGFSTRQETQQAANTITTTWGYGSDYSFVQIFFCLAVIVIYQLYANLPATPPSLEAAAPANAATPSQVDQKR